ncbi:arsenate reductase family protein [Streptomyces sp. H27-H1]|uniref:ArsC/Spx/MgsR family protein n=1 Tax=Streptomyces sp. H27-H1 TaxID=2996461 RepID=UPI00227189CC|nr:ArsC/Spx/MgsR family protein [Streptomyces sp. H27-H1]MCY0926589.1 arsenate reductase family protein [Streptomyces sp. H27-H1]
MEIWINPACSKCRSALALLDAEGAEYTVRRYLEDVPSEAEIREVLGRLGLEPWDITRTSDPLAKETGPGVPPDGVWGRDLPREETEEARGRWISHLAAHPKLIQRPIITAEDGTAVVARSEEAVREALSRTSTAGAP